MATKADDSSSLPEAGTTAGFGEAFDGVVEPDAPGDNVEMFGGAVEPEPRVEVRETTKAHVTFVHPKRVAYWSSVAAVIHTAACARCFFIHEYLICTWIGFMALATVFQYYVAGVDAERQAAESPIRVAWYRGDDYACWMCGHIDALASRLPACPACGSTEGPTNLPRI